MANTPGDAAIVLSKSPTFSRLANDTALQVYAINAALQFMWQAHTWRQSLAEFPPFYLTPGEPYHLDPDIDIPTDFWYLHKAWLDRLYGNTYDLDVMSSLSPAGYQSRPCAISYDVSRSGFLLSPTPPQGWDAPETVVRGIYKTKPTQYTGATVNKTELPFDDQHFHLFVEALRVAYYDLLEDQRAGQVQFVNGNRMYTGARGKFFALLRETLLPELQGAGQVPVVPEYNLSLGGSSWSGGHGW